MTFCRYISIHPRIYGIGVASCRSAIFQLDTKIFTRYRYTYFGIEYVQGGKEAGKDNSANAIIGVVTKSIAVESSPVISFI